MHRSGTSAVAGFIHECGFELASESLPAHHEDNPLGYFEAASIVRLNNQLLAALGESWKTFNDIPERVLQSPVTEQYRVQIESVLEAAKAGSKRLVLKDPRICRLLPFWMPILEQHFSRLAVVKVVRSPDKVYRSLAARAGSEDIAAAAIEDPYHAFALWLHYTARMEKYDFQNPCLRIDFSDWVSEQQGIKKGHDASKQLLEFLSQHFQIDTDTPVEPAAYQPRHLNSPVTEGRDLEFRICRNIYHGLKQDVASSGFSVTLKDIETEVPAGHQNEAPPPEMRQIAQGYIKQHGRLANRTRPLKARKFWQRKARAPFLYLSQNSRPKSHIYRVINMIEGIGLQGGDADWMYPGNALEADVISNRPKAVVFQRCEWDEDIANLVRQCRTHGIAMGVDVDDLLFDDEVIKAGYLHFANASEASRSEWLERSQSIVKVMKSADFVVVTTKAMFESARAFCDHVIVAPNGVSEVNVRFAEHWRRDRPVPGDGCQRIGYASGTPTHDEDFRTIIAPLKDFLARHPDWRLTIIGALNRDMLREHFSEAQLEFRPFVDHVNLAYELARLDINLVPLEPDNPFCTAKSPLKWYESALVGTPSIACANATFSEYIENGRHGFVAASDAEWFDSMMRLAGDESLRKNVVNAANQKILPRLSSRTIASAMLADLQKLGMIK